MAGADCYNCKERKLGCHSTCKSYLEFKQRLAKIKKKKEEYRKGFPISKHKNYKTK